MAKANVLDKRALTSSFAELADALKQAVMNSDLDRQAKENFLHNLATWPLRLETVARNQTRLCGAKNRQAEADEGEG